MSVSNKEVGALKCLLVNMNTTELFESMSVYSEDSDGSVMYWKNLSQMLQGQATSKMMTYQDTIKDAKLVD